MKLTDLIKALTDVVAEVGEVNVYFTTKNETKLYDTVLVHYIEENKNLPKPILRLEGTDDDDYEDEDDDYDDDDDYYDDEEDEDE